MSLEDVKARVPMADFITDMRVTRAIELVKDNAVIDNSILENKEEEKEAE